jgi:hypothetical protein
MTRLSANERRARAINAAQVVAQEYGAQVGRPVILKDTNHTIVHLAPEPIVAKVSVERRFRHDSSSLEREVLVARLLAEAGAPVVGPANTLNNRQWLDGLIITDRHDFCGADTEMLIQEKEFLEGLG